MKTIDANANFVTSNNTPCIIFAIPQLDQANQCFLETLFTNNILYNALKPSKSITRHP
jgi:hypothetical protein